jgi:hypothetical protein
MTGSEMLTRFLTMPFVLKKLISLGYCRIVGAYGCTLEESLA